MGLFVEPVINFMFKNVTLLEFNQNPHFLLSVIFVWVTCGCCLSAGISFFHLDVFSAWFPGSRRWCGQCSFSETTGPYPQPRWVEHTPTHFHTQRALMFFVHCPVERCELSFIDLRYRVSVLSCWPGCPFPSSVWLEFCPFTEVVEKGSAAYHQHCVWSLWTSN